MTWKTKSTLYDELFNKASALLEEYNPCKIQDGTCIRFRKKLGKNFCCEGCKNLSPQGCTVKALYCRVWMCFSCDCSDVTDVFTKGETKKAILKYKEFNRKMTVLRNIARKYHLLRERAGKKESLTFAELFKDDDE